MVETITPVVYGRRSGYLLALLLHTLAATTTAGLTGALLGTIGMLFGAPWGPAGAIAVAAVAAIYLLREAVGIPVPLPNARRQVPEWWRTFFSPPVAAALYGAGLGVAFATFLSFGTFVAVAAGAVAGGDPALGALVCAPFGLARAIAVGVIGLRTREPGSAVTELSSLGATPVPRTVNSVALLAVAVTGTIVAL
jgi:hypothetical protein